MIAQIAMLAAGACYLVAGGAYVFEGKYWSAATVAMYAGCCVTFFMAGRA